MRKYISTGLVFSYTIYLILIFTDNSESILNIKSILWLIWFISPLTPLLLLINSNLENGETKKSRNMYYFISALFGAYLYTQALYTQSVSIEDKIGNSLIIIIIPLFQWILNLIMFQIWHLKERKESKGKGS